MNADKKLQTVIKDGLVYSSVGAGFSAGPAMHDAKIAHEMLPILRQLAAVVRIDSTRHQSRLVNLGRQESNPCPCDACTLDRQVLALAEPFLED